MNQALNLEFVTNSIKSVELMYREQIELKNDNVTGILAVANFLGCMDLLNVIDKYMPDSMPTKSVLQIYELAHCHSGTAKEEAANGYGYPQTALLFLMISIGPMRSVLAL